MAKNSASGCGTLFLIALVVGGCSQLFGCDNKDDKPEPAATQTATPVTLPDWKKKPLIEVENEAEALGVEVIADGVTGSYCSEEDDCFVYKQVPAAGSVVRKGARVAVRFVTGEERAFYRKYKT